jgi:hypothetical protein
VNRVLSSVTVVVTVRRSYRDQTFRTTYWLKRPNLSDPELFEPPAEWG